MKILANSKPYPEPAGRVRELEVHGVVHRVDQFVRIDGQAGEYKIRHFDTARNGDDPTVEVFGGAPGRAMIRTFYARLIVPPDGTTAAVTHHARALAPDTIRDAIIEKGRAEVRLKNPNDKGERKRTMNRVFSRAYTLGLKGKFKVRVEGDLVIGERCDPAD